jgi:uracil DNA glycosylase
MTDEDRLALAALFEGGGEPWQPLLAPVLARHHEAETFIGPQRDKTIVPLRELTFQALKPNPPGKWRVVIFGQNPYPRVESATGIAMFDNAFSDWQSPQFGKVTSIRCIIKAACIHEHKIDKATSTADVRRLLTEHAVVGPPEWFHAMLAQGVLLLNASLTASTDDALSTSRHTAFWKPIVETIVEEILKAKAKGGAGADGGVVFAWWGSHAKALRKTVEKLQARYPAARVRHVDHCNPAAMGDAFCNGDHFGDINDAVTALGMEKVDWLPRVGWNLRAGRDAQETQRLGDFIEKTRELHKLYLDRLQGAAEEQLTELAPIDGIGALPLPTLHDAAAPLVTLFPALAFYVKHGEAFAEKARAEAPTLTTHEIATLFLYTTESVLYRQLNAVLRHPDRAKASPWRGYLRLFLSALAKLDVHTGSLYRGVAKDLRADYPVGRTITWWGVSSCTSNLAVARGFLGGQGRRMLFEITPRAAVSIKAFSAFKGEDEYVLGPGTRLAVSEVRHQPDGLSLVRLTELAEARLVA